MISRLITIFVVLVVVIGLFLHYQAEVPGLTPWIGHLPGDLIMKKGKITIYFPFTSALILSAILSTLAFLLTPPRK